jgi:hypothetical protein
MKVNPIAQFEAFIAMMMAMYPKHVGHKSKAAPQHI